MTGRARAAAPVRRRFTVLPSSLGFEVIDADGRPVDTRPSRLEAEDEAAGFNRAAAAGSRTLTAALSNPRVLSFDLSDGTHLS